MWDIKAKTESFSLFSFHRVEIYDEIGYDKKDNLS